MLMTEVFDKLKDLQDILAEKYTLEDKIQASPEQLRSRDELLTKLKKEYLERNTEYEAVKVRVEKLKEDLADAVASREAGEKGMDNITTHREYEALDKQITEASEREAVIRKDLQKEEKILGELNENLKSDEAMIQSQEADLNSDKEKLSQEVEGYKSELDALNKKENEIIPGLDTEIVYKFQRIIKRNSEGIVAVRNGVCTGCHMILPAQFANEVHDGEKILFCPYCSRILFHEDVAAGEEQNFFTMEDSDSYLDSDDEFDDSLLEDALEDESDEDMELDDGEKTLTFEE